MWGHFAQGNSLLWGFPVFFACHLTSSLGMPPCPCVLDLFAFSISWFWKPWKYSLIQGLSESRDSNFQAQFLQQLHKTRVSTPISPVGPTLRSLPLCCRHSGTELRVQTELSSPHTTRLAFPSHGITRLLWTLPLPLTALVWRSVLSQSTSPGVCDE